METINDRMQQIADYFCNGNKAAFAKAIGIAPTSISNYLGKQRASKPSSDLLEKIVNSLEVDAMWLLTGKGEMVRKTVAQYDGTEELNNSERSFYQQQISFLSERMRAIDERNRELEEELLNQIREKGANVG